MKSPLAYVGGKSKLAKTIIEMLPEHKTYCECFAGAGWVFFKKEPIKAERLNDLDSDLVSFYRVLQNHPEEFLRQFKYMLASRELWQDAGRQLDAGGLTDIQRAARYYYRMRLAFGGRVTGQAFGASVDGLPRFNLLRIEEELTAVHLRLAQVVIENLPYDKFIAKYDRPETFFFADPPYYKAPYYKHNLVLEDYEAMRANLEQVKGKFLLTINDCDEMREVFKQFKIKSVSLSYSLCKEKSTVGKELIITNY